MQDQEGTLVQVTMAELTKEALARLEAEGERERRLREELAAAESALAQAQRDLEGARFERERVAAKPLRDAQERLREVGLLAQRGAIEVAQKRRQFEQLEDAPSEEVCALAGRLFLDTAAGGDHLEAWRQFSGQITPDDPELRQLLQAWRQLEHERRKKVLDFSQDQLALSLLRIEKAILGSVQTPEEAFEIVRNVPSAWTAENGRRRSPSRAATGPAAQSKSERS